MELGVFETKNRLSSLLDAVEEGEEVVITRNGRKIARLVREQASVNRDKAVRAVETLAVMRTGVRLGPELSLRSLIDEGRL